MPVSRRLVLVVVLGLLLGPVASAHAASIWTPVDSGTTDTISAVVYQSPTRLWYATTNGKIEYFNGSRFVAGTGIPAGENFADLAFQPTSVPGGPGTAGLYGYAVTSTGHIWQTSNGGVSWTQLASPTTPADCSVTPTTTPAPVAELNAVAWAGGSVVYLLGNNSTLLKSTAANSPTPAFTEINKVGTGTCAAQSQSYVENLTDAVFLGANPLDGFIVDQSFGSLYSTSNGFASGVKTGDTVNNYNGNPRIAQDAANPNRLWIVDHQAGGGGCGELCLEYSTDGGTTAAHATFPNDNTPTAGLYDVSSQGGTEVTAGSGGEIFTSNDGTAFDLHRAAGALATEDWRAADAYDAAHAVVAGVGGALVLTAQANAVKAQPPSGQQAVIKSAGGASATIFKVVYVTGRSARYVPVTLSAPQPRTFTVSILAARGKHRVASARLKIKHGHKAFRVGLSKKAKPGKYVIVVVVRNRHGIPLGRRITVTFTLK